MGAPKWTPGPWMTDPEVEHEAVVGSRGFMVADCAIFSLRKGAPTDQENRANARLIAAAPDLAEACRMLVESYDADAGTYALGKLYDAREAARAALAKARGETP